MNKMFERFAYLKNMQQLKFVYRKISVPKRINAEDYIKNFFLLKGYNVKKFYGRPKGIPDFLCSKGNKNFYVEVKTNNDGLRINQIKWINENKDKKIFVVILEQKINKKVSPKTKKKFNKKLCSICCTWKDPSIITKIKNINVCDYCIENGDDFFNNQELNKMMVPNGR